MRVLQTCRKIGIYRTVGEWYTPLPPAFMRACDPTATSGGVKGGEQWAVVAL